MLNKNDILNLIKKYNLDHEEIKINSGAAMVLHGLKEKTNDIDITRLVVEVKSEIEKMREQIQNVE